MHRLKDRSPASLGRRCSRQGALSCGLATRATGTSLGSVAGRGSDTRRLKRLRSQRSCIHLDQRRKKLAVAGVPAGIGWARTAVEAEVLRTTDCVLLIRPGVDQLAVASLTQIDFVNPTLDAVAEHGPIVAI